MNIDVLFTEIGLSGDIEAGLKLAQEAVKQRPDLAVLYTSDQVVTDGMKELFVANSSFLPKPYTADRVVASLVVHFGLRAHDVVSVAVPNGASDPKQSQDHP